MKKIRAASQWEESVFNSDDPADEDSDDRPKTALTFFLPGKRTIHIPWEDAREWDVG